MNPHIWKAFQDIPGASLPVADRVYCLLSELSEVVGSLCSHKYLPRFAFLLDDIFNQLKEKKEDVDVDSDSLNSYIEDIQAEFRKRLYGNQETGSAPLDQKKHPLFTLKFNVADMANGIGGDNIGGPEEDLCSFEDVLSIVKELESHISERGVLNDQVYRLKIEISSRVLDNICRLAQTPLVFIIPVYAHYYKYILKWKNIEHNPLSLVAWWTINVECMHNPACNSSLMDDFGHLDDDQFQIILKDITQYNIIPDPLGMEKTKQKI